MLNSSIAPLLVVCERPPVIRVVFADLVHRMLRVRASKRITIDEILAHPWIRSLHQEVIATRPDLEAATVGIKERTLEAQVAIGMHGAGGGGGGGVVLPVGAAAVDLV